MEKLEHTVFQISELIGKERFGTLSEEENEVLEEWRRQSAEHETLYQKLQDTRYLSESVARLSGIDTRQPLLHMQRQIAGFTRRRQILRLRQIGGVAALFLILLGSFWLVHRQSSLRQPPVDGPFWQEGLVLFYIWETANSSIWIPCNKRLHKERSGFLRPTTGNYPMIAGRKKMRNQEKWCIMK